MRIGRYWQPCTQTYNGHIVLTESSSDYPYSFAILFGEITKSWTQTILVKQGKNSAFQKNMTTCTVGNSNWEWIGFSLQLDRWLCMYVFRFTGFSFSNEAGGECLFKGGDNVSTQRPFNLRAKDANRPRSSLAVGRPSTEKEHTALR